jgi:hypothetical protein
MAVADSPWYANETESGVYLDFGDVRAVKIYCDMKP